MEDAMMKLRGKLSYHRVEDEVTNEGWDGGDSDGDDDDQLISGSVYFDDDAVDEKHFGDTIEAEA